MPANSPLSRLDDVSGTLARLWLEARVAVAFLTRVPFPADDLGEIRLAQAVRTFPLVGLAVGFAGAAVYLLADMINLPPIVAALLAVGAVIVVTGGLHEDGLADMADGLGGGRDRASMLAIMRDSRIGTFGVLALIFAVGLRVAAVAALAVPETVALALIAAAGGSRACLPPVMYALPPARGDGLSFDAGVPDRGHVLAAVAIGWVVLMIGLGFLGGLLAILLAGLTGGALIYLAQQKLGGQTGDVLGAIQQATEVAILLAAVMALT
jgi:adenosylcobinamide-GDP ribazoletransferase